MQLAHVGMSLAIATYAGDHDVTFFVLANTFHHLPSLDQLFVDLKLAPKEFHDAELHTPFFALVVSAVVSLFSWRYGLLAFISIISHVLMDLPTKSGIMLLYPFSRKRFSLNLWRNTGAWGIREFYSQKWAWILEAPIWAFMILRLVERGPWKIFG